MSIFLSSLLCAGIFWLVSTQMPADASTIDSYSITQFFDQYAAFAGAVMGLISLLGMLIAKGFLALFKTGKSRVTNSILIILGFAPWAAFGYQLVYREPRYANIAKAIIEYLGEPLLYSALATVGFGILLLIISLIKKPKTS